MIPEEVKNKIEEKFPKTFVSGGVRFDDYHVSSKREAAQFGYQLAETEISRLKFLIKESFIALNLEWKKSQAQIDADWEQYKIENKL